MKHILLTFATFFICSLFCSQVLAAKPDIRCRPALYLGGKLVKTNQINKDSKMVTLDKPLEVLKSESIMQKDGFHFFNVSYFVMIDSEKNWLSTSLFYNALSYGGKQDSILQLKLKETDPNIIGYSKGVWMMVVRHNIGLKEGENSITLKLDSASSVDESKEDNNLYTFKITLKP